MSLKVLQFGATGALARELLARAGADVEIVALTRAEADLADPASLAAAVAAHPDAALVVNTAAYTAVDKAESEPDLAYAVNAAGPRAIARACARADLPLIHISTDMVFSGAKASAYVETDPVGPLHIYGASKLAGETGVLDTCGRAMVLRVSWLFSAFGQNFLQAMLRLSETQALLKVVDDQRARPTASRDVADFILAQARRLSQAPAGAPEWGVTHFANQGAATRYDMAQAIFELARTGRPAPVIEPVPTSAFPTPARRALNGELDTTRLETIFGVRPRPWRDAMAEVLAQMGLGDRRDAA